MSKLLLFSDIHVHSHKASQERLQNCLDALYWVFQTARDRGIQDVVFGGDLFHDRQKIQVLTYHKTFNIIEQFSDLRIYLLLGNHDLWYFDKTDISSVIPIGALSHVTVISKPSTLTIAGLPIDFLPFTHDPMTAIVENFPKKSPVMVGHVAVDGAILNFHHRTKSEVSIEIENDMQVMSREMFDGYERVFLGHYHGQQNLTDKVEYIGSTLELSFGEAFQQKHIIALDTDDLSREYIINNFSPKHLILTPQELSEHNLNGNFLRVHIEDMGKVDMMDVRSKVMEENPEAKITFVMEKPKTQQLEHVEKFNITEGDTLVRYVEAVGCGDLNKVALLSLGKEICAES
jgi:DNA repair exonuclease SbcCD nuclease subunit